jgi:hypothetical protein
MKSSTVSPASVPGGKPAFARSVVGLLLVALGDGGLTVVLATLGGQSVGISPWAVGVALIAFAIFVVGVVVTVCSFVALARDAWHRRNAASTK